MTDNTFGVLNHQFSLIWDGLVRPSAKIQDKETQQHARLLSGMLLVVAMTLLVIVFIVGAINRASLLNSATIIAYISIVVCITLYFVNRVGRFDWARVLFILYFGIATISIPYIPNSVTGLLPMAVIPVILVGIFYSKRSMYGVASGVLIITFLLNQTMRHTEYYIAMQDDWYFLIFVTGLIVVFVRHKNALEQLHIRDLKIANQQLRESERLLEQRVEERTAELLEAYNEMEALNRIKDEFVSNVSHELRTPISSIKLQKYLLQQVSFPQQQKYLDVLARETDRLEESIESLLRLSRLDQQRQKLEFEKVNLNTLVEQYVGDRESLAQKQSLTLSAILTCEDGIWVRGDVSLLGQVVSILLTNALNYTTTGGSITVTTSIIHEKDRPRWGCLSVKDTGIGILPEEQEKLFHRFYRGSAASERKITGTGLGLSIAKAIIDNHHGTISVESTGVPGEGTSFHVKLPLYS